MFRAAAAGPFDEAVGKATDENATSEDWSAILEVCDRVSSDAANGPKEAVQSLTKRLAHRNANVQLYTLELANALSQNCGTPMHRELASRAFTDALLKLANDRNTHNLVRLKILERMKEWSDMFRSNTDLGIMQDAYNRLQHSQPQLHVAPSAPQKNSLTDADRQREEEDLQRALKLSLEDEASKQQAAPGGGSTATASNAASGAGSSGYSSSGPAAAAPAHTQGTTAATVSRVRALYDFVASEQDELDFKKGDIIAVLESAYRDWWRGSLKGRTGIFPLNYVEILTDPTPDELQREAQMEAEVFAEIKNVEKLLTLLSASNMSPREEDTDEISKLHHQTLAIRPKLIKLIEKYSQKKDDFTQLNEKFIKARRDYEALLESSMAHPPQPNYQQYAMHQQHLPPQNYQLPSGASHVASHSGYAAPGAGQQPPDQRYYTPGPQQQDQQRLPQSPSPNMHRPSTTAAPAAFYLVNAEIPAPQQARHEFAPQQHQHLPPQQQNSYPSPSGEQGQRMPPGTGPAGPERQSSPLHTSMYPAQQAPASNTNSSYLPYNPHRASVSGPGGPSSAYSHTQEVPSSTYVSSVASHYPNAAAVLASDPQQQQSTAATNSTSISSPNQYSPPSIGGSPTGPPPQVESSGVRPNQAYTSYVSYSNPQYYHPHQPSAPAQPISAPLPASSSGHYDASNAAASGSQDLRLSLSSRMSPSSEQQQYQPYVPPSDAPLSQATAPSADSYYR
ncbi:ESCRT-0 subunit protein hse1 [Sporothrix epigloea]|uniref:Class E vacuolar protein-sorting machinery protein HSE1 n=1 Tax=Sporothrix epigloea TaxID=1892477 RepID=A0ABP0DVD2_9PEZI